MYTGKEKFSWLSDEEIWLALISLKAKKNIISFALERGDIDTVHDYDLLVMLETLGFYLEVPDEIRKEESKEYIKKTIEDYEKTLKTYQKVKKDPLLRDFFDDDIELIKKMVTKKKKLKSMKKIRVRDLTEIKRYLKPIINNFNEKGWNKTQQTDFFYDLFYSFDYDNCRNIDPKSFKKKLWMTIHRL